MATEQGYLLVVDDDPMNRMLLAHGLKQEGHEVTLAEDGAEALDLLHDDAFDVVLLDILMPGMDGYEVLAEIKKDSTLRHIPVIMISALEELESVVRCLEMGADDYLSKPFDPALLRARINGCLAKKRLHDLEMAYLSQVQKEKKRADDLLNVVIPIGVALSGESDFHRLLEKIMLEAKTFCHADCGALYLRTADNLLEYEIVRHDPHRLMLGGSVGQPISLPPVQLYQQATGRPNTRQLVANAALNGLSVNIADTSDTPSLDPNDPTIFYLPGYKPTSLLIVPLKNNQNRVVGVLQLCDARDPQTDQLIPFDQHLQQMIESLSSLATVALEAYLREQRLRQQIEALRIEVDEARISRQVSEITESHYFQNLQARVDQLRFDDEPDEPGADHG
jgi:DNA-binding response OmpR family regulator